MAARSAARSPCISRELARVQSARTSRTPHRRSDGSTASSPALACGGHQAYYVSPPLKEDVVSRATSRRDLTVTSTQPGGNLVAILRHLPSEVPCEPDASDPLSMLYRPSRDRSRPHADGSSSLEDPRRAPGLPVLEPTRVRVPSGPFAAFVPAGDSLVLFIGGGSAELEPDPFQPVIAITHGQGSSQAPSVYRSSRATSDSRGEW